MTAIQLYTKLIEEADSGISSDYKEDIRAIDPAQRALVGGYFLNETLNDSIPITTCLCRISQRLLPQVKDSTDQVGIGWLILKPLYLNGLIDIERQSIRVSKQTQGIRANLFKAFKESSQNRKKKGDWTPTMFTEPTSAKAKEFLWKLFSEFDVETIELDRNKVFNKKPKEWTGFYHNDVTTGISFGKIITNANKRVKEHFHGRKIQPVLDAVNKLQSTTFFINESVLERLEMDSKAILESIKESADTSDSAKSKQNDFNQVIKRARVNVGKEVYSSIYLDTRGRTYYGASYLNRSGNDYAKGVLMVEPEEIGTKGWDALLVAAVDFRAKDKQEKMSRAEKLDIADADLDEFIAVANGASYMEAEEKAQYLSVCIDIRNADEMGANYTKYKSGVLLSRDASQSGPMLMGIATQDENTMKYTNVLEDDKRYDLYEELGAEMLGLLKASDLPAYDGSLDDMVFDANTNEGITNLHQNKEMLKSKAKADFLRMFSEDDAALRKWSKYPLMLFGYSAEQWCIANDLWDKFQFKYKWLTPVHVKFLADLYYEAAKTSIPAVHQFMEGLKDLASVVHKQDSDLLVKASYSGFPFMQNYYRMESKTKYIYGKSAKKNNGVKEKIGLRVDVETTKRNYSKTKSGTPANSIHSIDSDLLKMVVNNFPHDMATNHDAFFATPARIGELDEVLRECTLKLGTEYDLLGNITSNYGLTPADINININERHPRFNPAANEYCYS